MTVAVEAHGVAKRYGKVEALKGLNLTVPARRVVGLVGPNGAGKTTLLHLAMGLLTPSEGSIEVLGQIPRRDPMAILRRVAIVVQERPLYRNLTVAETLELGRRLNSRWDAQSQLRRLRRLEIPLDRRIGTLSTGQQAQVALALAFGKRPELLLLDEPVANLDPLARRHVLAELMDAVGESGMTVLLASNSVSDLERVCDYLLMLNQGQLQLAGTIDDLLRRHLLVLAPAGFEQRLPAGMQIVQETRATRQTAMVVRVMNGRWNGTTPDDVEFRTLTLEELVLAYLAEPSKRTVLGAVPEEAAP